MHATVTGNIARVEVTQTFTNPCDAWVGGLVRVPAARGRGGRPDVHAGRRAAHRGRDPRARGRTPGLRKGQERRAAGRAWWTRSGPTCSPAPWPTSPPAAASPSPSLTWIPIAFRDGRFRLSLPLAITPRYTPGATADPEVGATGAVAPEDLPREAGGAAGQRPTARARDERAAERLDPGGPCARLRTGAPWRACTTRSPRPRPLPDGASPSTQPRCPPIGISSWCGSHRCCPTPRRRPSPSTWGAMTTCSSC